VAVKRRSEHPLLSIAEAKIENWRSCLIEKFTNKEDPAKIAYLLIIRACSRINSIMPRAMQTGRSEAVINLIRHELFALQFGLDILSDQLPAESQIDEDEISSSTDNSLLKRMDVALYQLIDYSHVRDAFLSYYYGAFDLKAQNPERLTFVDSPDWSGGDDFSESFISAETKQSRLPDSVLLNNKSPYLPLELDMGGLSLAIFLKLWGILKAMLSSFSSNVGAPVEEYEDFINKLCHNSRLDKEPIKRFCRTNWFLSRRTRKRFDIAIGDYIGYGFENSDANPLVQMKNPQSRARVRHVEKNILSIEVEHDDRKWDGDISMEHAAFGTVVWRYVDYPKGKHAFGFKRIMVREETDEVYLYLIREKPFSKEVFVKSK